MSRAAAATRHNQRELGVGKFASQATLRAQQRALLAPASRWRKEWVRPSSSSAAAGASNGSGSYRVLKWVKYDEGGELAEDGDQPTEEQVTAAVTGAQTLLAPAPTGAATASAADTPGTMANGTPTASTSMAGTPAAMPGPGPSSSATAGGHHHLAAPTTTIRSALRHDVSRSPTVSGAATPMATAAAMAAGEGSLLGSSSLANEVQAEDVDIADEAAVQQQQQEDEESGNMPIDAAQSQSQMDIEVTQPPSPPPAAENEDIQIPTEADEQAVDARQEVEEREHDVRMAPELVGEEAAETRAALGIGDPVEGGPAEITG